MDSESKSGDDCEARERASAYLSSREWEERLAAARAQREKALSAKAAASAGGSPQATTVPDPAGEAEGAATPGASRPDDPLASFARAFGSSPAPGATKRNGSGAPDRTHSDATTAGETPPRGSAGHTPFAEAWSEPPADHASGRPPPRRDRAIALSQALVVVAAALGAELLVSPHHVERSPPELMAATRATPITLAPDAAAAPTPEPLKPASLKLASPSPEPPSLKAARPASLKSVALESRTLESALLESDPPIPMPPKRGPGAGQGVSVAASGDDMGYGGGAPGTAHSGNRQGDRAGGKVAAADRNASAARRGRNADSLDDFLDNMQRDADRLIYRVFGR